MSILTQKILLIIVLLIIAGAIFKAMLPVIGIFAIGLAIWASRIFKDRVRTKKKSKNYRN